jgi:DUF1680 family protein
LCQAICIHLLPPSQPVSLTVNGEPVLYETEKGYAVISREWNPGDVVGFSIPMEIRRVEANALVKDDSAKVAIERGPIVYCLEGVDNGPNLMKLALPDSSKLRAIFHPEELTGVVTISGGAVVVEGKKEQAQKITAIPYFVWDNRGINEMKVWLPRQ